MARAMRQRPILAFAGQTKPFAQNSLESKKRKLQPIEEEESDDAQLLQIASSKKRRIVGLVTPPRTPTPPAIQDNSTSLEDLKKLNSAFLSAISLNYAHNGTCSSLDLRAILPSVTKTWGKRQVDLDDVRALLSIYGNDFFRLLNFGDGKVCIEMSPISVNERRSRKRQYNAPSFGLQFNEAELRNDFAAKLDQAWNDWLKTRSNDYIDEISSFLKSVAKKQPLEESSTVRKIAPLRAKGQQRLEEVLGPLMKKIQISDESTPPEAPAKRLKRDGSAQKRPQLSRTTPTFPPSTCCSKNEESPKPESTASRSASLLSRIRAKEAFLAAQTAGPTKEERERLAALQRAQELFDILNLLAVSKGGIKVSFPLPTLMTNVQASIRNPLSKEEIIRCVTLLQKEITPGHISLVTFGSITGVVVDRSRKPAAALVAERLRERGV